MLDAEPSVPASLDAVNRARSAEFRTSIEGMENPYGDGTAAPKIVSVLRDVPLVEELLIKRPHAIEGLAAWR